MYLDCREGITMTMMIVRRGDDDAGYIQNDQSRANNALWQLGCGTMHMKRSVTLSLSLSHTCRHTQNINQIEKL